MSELARLEATAAQVNAAREAVNEFAATSRSPEARQLLAAALESHMTAIKRLYEQLKFSNAPRGKRGA